MKKRNINEISIKKLVYTHLQDTFCGVQKSLNYNIISR